MRTSELPPLPEPSWPFGSKYNEKDMQAYAIAAIAAQGVPDHCDPSSTTYDLAAMVMSDCGHSTNNQRLLDRIAARIDKHVESLLASAPPTPQAAIAAQGVPEPQKYDDVLLPFLEMMRKELHANSGKGDRPGWLSMDANTALLEVYYHLAKLQKAVRNNDGAGIQEFSADVANMAMMVLDVCGGLASAPPAPQAAPIDMVLHCPACGMQHIDAPETHEAFHGDGGPVEVATWTNPPHRSHLCHGCGHVWRPADVPTNGVLAVKTKGKADSPLAAVAQQENDAVSYVLRWGGNCRDCADEGGVCPGSGLPCGGARKAIEHVLKAVRYGVQQGYIRDPLASAQQAKPQLLSDDQHEQMMKGKSTLDYGRAVERHYGVTGGDERRHIICLCPDCVKPKPTTLQTLHEFVRRTASLLSEAQVELRCTAAGTLLIGVRYYEGNVRYGYQRGFTESHLSEPHSDTSWWGQLEEIARQYKE